MTTETESGHICQEDNHPKTYLWPYNPDIDHIAGRTIGDLCKENKGLLVFPDTLGRHNDGVGKLCLFTKERHDKEKVTIHTGNLMGFVGRGKTQITIYSRFAELQGNNRQDYFLHYMLQTVSAVNLLDMQHGRSNDEVFDFLLYLFPYYLKRAVQQGIFRQYCTRHYNDANIKGPVDLPRHIHNNIPFNGRIAYRTREYVCDNPLTQLIRHTIEFLRSKTEVSSILSIDDEMRNAVMTINAATPGYSFGARQRIIAENIRPVHHPYFLNYKPLQQLCIRILQHQHIKFSHSENHVYGILFDGAWLWEEYLHKSVLNSCGFRHPRNKSGKGGIPLFKNNSGFTRFPDYYKEGIILDAKYKRLNNNEIDREDMHQLISYMYIKEAPTGGFIYPQKEESRDISDVCLGELHGYGGKIHRIGVPIPQSCLSYKEFTSRMQEIEDKLRKTINRLDGQR